MNPGASTDRFSHRSKPLQYARPNRIKGNRGIRCVCTSVITSKNSSSVPKPPGMNTNATLYFTKHTFREKK